MAAGVHETTLRNVILELRVEADYGQIYIFDPAALPEDVRDEGDDPVFRALDDGYDSRRFVGYAEGLVDLLTPSQYNVDVSMRVEVLESEPELDTEQWDHVVEVPLPVPSGTLCFQASGGGGVIEARIPAERYRARVSGRGYVAGAGEIEGHETYRLQLWPAPESQPTLLKYWDGWDVMAPA
jgi:hypothetical protein